MKTLENLIIFQNVKLWLHNNIFFKRYNFYLYSKIYVIISYILFYIYKVTYHLLLLNIYNLLR